MPAVAFLNMTAVMVFLSENVTAVTFRFRKDSI